MSERALTGNAADRRQVERAGRKQALRRDGELADLRAVLALPSGRRMLWRLLEDCKVFGSIWHPSALIHFNEGRRDVGLKLMASITAANENALLQMMAEAQARGRSLEAGPGAAEMAKESGEGPEPQEEDEILG